MKDLPQIITSVVTLLGVGGIIGSYITFRLNRSKELEFQQREQKEKRYKSIMLFMDAYLNPANTTYLSNIHPALKNARDTKEWLKAEYHDMMLYASKEVIEAVRDFINAPLEESFASAILAMRKDLRDKQSDLAPRDIELRIKS
jgi:hypothetical protein